MIKKIIFIIFVLLLMGSIPILLSYRSQQTAPQEPDSSPTPVEMQTDLKIKSSIPYWDQPKALTSFRNSLKKHDYLNLFWYYLTDAGDIEKYENTIEDKSIISLAHDNNVKVFATITNLPEDGGWDSKRVEEMLRTRSSRQEHIEDIVDTLNKLDFDGVNIDYEEVNASEKNRFSIFIEELATELRKENKLLSISLHPKRAGSQGLGAFQDWKRLSTNADQLTIMAFNEHYDEGRAGPVASLPWVESILDYARSLQVPPEKIYLGIPLFGYDWNQDNEDAAEGLTYENVITILNDHDIGSDWDGTDKSPYFYYEDDGDEHEVWYENVRSVREKTQLAENRGLAGVSFWRLGGEDSKIWDEL